MTNLKEVNFGLNQYCGPAVMSALTGKSTDECASIISRVSGQREIKAVNIDHLIEAFRRLRFDMIQVDRAAFTLYGNLSSLSDKPGMYIILVPKHVVAIEITGDKNIYLIDNHSKTPVHAEASARLSQKCDRVYKITEKPQPIFLRTEIEIVRYHSNTIHIVAWDIFENEDDKISRHLGNFMFKNISELEQIINELAKIGQTL
jgi:hypothetical protein